MEKEIKFKDNILFINKQKVVFSNNIRNIEKLDDIIIVLLSIPQKDEAIDNIYAVSYEGNMLWQVQSLKILFPYQINLPYEQMVIDGDEIRATDFYGRRYFIDARSGLIKKWDIVK